MRGLRSMFARVAGHASHGRLGSLVAGLLVLAIAACQEQPYRTCDTGLVCQLGYECSPKGEFCALRNGCGNGRIDFGEVCDDGNRVSGDGCSQSCTSDERCGNGVRDQSESCDDGNRAPSDGCSEACRLERCGNGELDRWEICDDGNSDNGDGCSADCLSTEECGNGHLDVIQEEACDDGNAVSGDGCSADCMDESCGNGIVDPGEGCDDGGTENGDGCSADCKSDETCGNGIVDFSIGEHCDEGTTGNGNGCNADCRRRTCGNGTREPGEACDDGNTASGDGCSASCLYEEECGNGALDPGELCDPGTGERCNADCSSDQRCNNGYHDPEMEQCDDGVNSPFCDFDCTRVSCGDGVRNDAAGETCDEGPFLASLVVSGFAPAIELVLGIFDYVATLPLSQSSATVTAIVATPGDELTIAGAPVASGTPSAELPLSPGDNIVDIVVESPLGEQRTYRLTLRRLARSCLELLTGQPGSGDGLYTIDPDLDGPGQPFETFCDMSTDGGGWTLVQRTVWDFAETRLLHTDYATFRGTLLGSPAPDEPFRVPAASWPALQQTREHLMRKVPRRASDGGDCGALYYKATEGVWTVPAGGGATLTGAIDPINLFNGTSALSAADDGPFASCVNSALGVPWLWNGCCNTCPSFQGSYWNDGAHPMSSGMSSPDLGGETMYARCAPDQPRRSDKVSYFYGINTMEYYLR